VTLKSLFDRILLVLAVVAVIAGLWELHAATDGLEVRRLWLGPIPVTVFRPDGGVPAPVVVIAHGFAGSQQLMLPFALTLAHNGYTAVTFDFPGHGRNPEPMRGGLADQAESHRVVLESLAQVVAFAKTLPGEDGRIALLGHSMASDIVVSQALADPSIAATVAVSLFSPAVTPAGPRDLLVIDGALEPAMLTDEGRRVVGMVAGGPVQERVTYGDMAKGTARRLSLSGGVEHIGVLYSAQSMRAALDWLNQVFGRSGSGQIDHRGPWLGLLYLGLIYLFRPLARLLPRVAPAPLGAGLGWRRFWPAAVAPAVLTPLILWKLPTDFMPILLGDYLTAHFAVYGLLTLVCLAMTRAPWPPLLRAGWGRLLVAALCVAAYAIVALGGPIDAYVTSFVPTAGRLALMPAVFVGTLLYFVSDEWLTRGPGSARGGYALTKLLLVLSLAGAVALNLHKLFFLIIITPVMLLFLIIYGILSTWAYRRTNHPLAGALGKALALAWAIAVTFPLVGS